MTMQAHSPPGKPDNVPEHTVGLPEDAAGIKFHKLCAIFLMKFHGCSVIAYNMLKNYFQKRNETLMK
jgi:hypothetical protein